MTVFSSYSAGTLSVSNGGTVVTGAGTTWSGINARPGDSIVINGLTPIVIMDVTDATHLVIDAWPFATQSAVPYKIIWNSPLRFVGGQAMADVDSLIQRLTANIFPTINGGALAASTLTLQSTSGVGTSDFISLKTGSQVERLRVATDGEVWINFNSNYAPTNSYLHLVSTSASPFATIYEMATNDSFGNAFQYVKSRGTVQGSVAAVQDGDKIASIGFYGGDGAAWRHAATMYVRAEGTPASGTTPGRFMFFTTPAGASQVPIERVRFDSIGQIVANIAGSTSIGSGVFFIANSVDGSNNPGFFSGRQYSNDASGGYIEFIKSRATTVGGSGLVSNNDNLGGIYWSGDTNSGGVLSTASIRVFVDAATTSGQRVASRMSFYTNANNASPVERLKIDSGGNSIFTAGSTTPPTLATNGNFNLTPTSNTNMRISYRGSDGVTRVGNITLA